MNQRAVGQLAFGRLDRPGELPALRDADHPVAAGNPHLRQCVHDGAHAERIEADRAQLATLVDPLGQRRDLGDVVAQVSNDPQFAGGLEVTEHRGLALAPFQHRTVRPAHHPDGRLDGQRARHDG